MKFFAQDIFAQDICNACACARILFVGNVSAPRALNARGQRVQHTVLELFQRENRLGVLEEELGLAQLRFGRFQTELPGDLFENGAAAICAMQKEAEEIRQRKR
jgi:hypothetical protein